MIKSCSFFLRYRTNPTYPIPITMMPMTAIRGLFIISPLPQRPNPAMISNALAGGFDVLTAAVVGIGDGLPAITVRLGFEVRLGLGVRTGVTVDVPLFGTGSLKIAKSEKWVTDVETVRAAGSVMVGRDSQALVEVLNVRMIGSLLFA